MSFKELAEQLASARQAEAGPAEGANAGGDAGGKDTSTALVKSFVFKLEDGTEVEAQDGTELVKALNARLGEIHESHESAMTELKEQVLTPMFELVKSLSTQVAALRGTGAGRRATVAMPAAAGAGTGAGGAKPNAIELMSKAHSAMESGRMNAAQVSECEHYLGQGMELPAHLVARLAS